MKHEDPREFNVFKAFKFWGGNPDILSNKKKFREESTPNDKIAMAKLTDIQFNQLKWPKPTISEFQIDNDGNIVPRHL